MHEIDQRRESHQLAAKAMHVNDRCLGFILLINIGDNMNDKMIVRPITRFSSRASDLFRSDQALRDDIARAQSRLIARTPG